MIGTNYLCSCAPQPNSGLASERDSDREVLLSFDDFLELMALKISYQRKLSSPNTVFESSKLILFG